MHIHIHIHIFAFPPIHQVTHIASNCAPDAPKPAWRRTTICVPTQMAIRRDVDGGTSGRSWGYVGTRPERAEAPSPGQRPG